MILNRASAPADGEPSVEAIERMSVDERRMLAERPNLPDALVQLLAADPEEEVRQAVAGRTELPAALVEMLAYDPKVPVRETTAQRPNLPLALIERLAADPKIWMRHTIARRPGLPLDLMVRLAADPEERVRRPIARRTDLPVTLIEQLGADRSESVRQAVAGRTEPGRDPDRRCVLREGQFHLAFPYNVDIVDACKALPRRRFDWPSKRWVVEATASNVVPLAALLATHEFMVDAESLSALERLVDPTQSAYPESAALPRSRQGRQAAIAAKALLADNVVYLDTETTGMESHDQAIEIGIVDASGSILLETRLKATVDSHWAAAKKHKITRAMLASAPEWPAVAGQEREALQGRVVVAYNAEFDVRILSQTAAAFGDRFDIGDQSQCAMKLAAAFLDAGDRVSLGKATEALGVEWSGCAHSAVADARATASLMRAMAMAVDADEQGADSDPEPLPAPGM